MMAVSPSTEWNVTPLAECPNCRRFLSLRVEKCPDCNELIDEGYAFYSALHVTVITQACSFANSIKYVDLASVIALLASIYIYALNEPWLLLLTPLMSVVPLFVILLWSYRFARFKFAEEDFVKAKSQMRASLWLWLGLLTVQLVALAALWF
jgi:hypothetical protein